MENLSSAATLPHFPQILKLDRSNYAFWRAQAISAIRAHGFHDFISTTAIAPPPLLPAPANTLPQPNPAHSLWIRRDQFLLSWMLSSVAESMLGHVVRCTNSRDCWSVLERLFMSQSKARIMQLRLLLQTTKKGSLSVEEFFLKMKGFADQLSAVGQVINDDELVMYILSGFGPEYEALVVNIMHRNDTQNLQEIQYSFQAYELRLQQQHSPSFDFAAHVAYRGNGKGAPSPSPHGSSPAPRGFNRSMPSNKSIVCQLCGRSGHVAIKCFKRFDINFTDNSATAPQAYLSDVANNADPASSQDPSFADPSWYVDSGATTHITNDLNNLALSNTYSGNEALMVGNGLQDTQDSAEGSSH